MANSQLLIQLKSTFDEKGVKQAEKAIAGVEKETKKASASFNSFGAIAESAASTLGAIGAAALVAKGTMNFSKEGASIAKINERFEALLSNIGANGADTMNALKDATGGGINELDLMTGSIKLLNFNLASSQDELTALTTKILQVKDPALTATEAIDSFGAMMANQSIERLDSFGLASGRVRARILELQEATEGLSREQAFNTAVMEALDEKIISLGDSSALTVDPIIRLETHVQNLTSDMKVFISDGLNPSIGAMADYVDTVMETESSVVDIGKAIKDIITPWEESTQIIEDSEQAVFDASDSYEDFQRTIKDTTDIFSDLTREEFENLKAVEANEQAVRDLAQAEEQNAQVTQRLTDSVEQNNQARRDASLASQEYFSNLFTGIEVTEEANNAEFRRGEALRASTEARQAQAQAQQSALSFTTALTAETQTASQAIFEQGQKAGFTAEQLAIAAGATGQYTEEQIQGALKAELYNAKLAELTEEVQSGRRSVESAITQLELFNQSLDSIPSEQTFTLRVNQVGDIRLPTSGGQTVGVPQVAARATGGVVPRGAPAIVGERGPELFIPQQSGNIVTNNNFSMNVSTQSNQSSVIRDFSMMQSILGA